MLIRALLAVSLVAFLPMVVAYFYAYSKLYDAVRDQRPEWLNYKGEPSIFYVGLPRRFDANISVRVLGVAFSRRARELQAGAYVYARAIRVILPSYLVMFGFLIWYFISRA